MKDMGDGEENPTNKRKSYLLENTKNKKMLGA